MLEAVAPPVAWHIFEGMGFEGHMQMLPRLGDPYYPAADVMDQWLAEIGCPDKDSSIAGDH